MYKYITQEAICHENISLCFQNIEESSNGEPSVSAFYVVSIWAVMMQERTGCIRVGFAEEKRGSSRGDEGKR